MDSSSDWRYSGAYAPPLPNFQRGMPSFRALSVCFGIEIDPLFVDVVIRRWQAFTGEVAKRASDGMFFESIVPEAVAIEEVS
jgi:hypothetical protein